MGDTETDTNEENVPVLEKDIAIKKVESIPIGLTQTLLGILMNQVTATDVEKGIATDTAAIITIAEKAQREKLIRLRSRNVCSDSLKLDFWPRRNLLNKINRWPMNRA